MSREHFKPKHLVITESYRFYNAKQEDGEYVFNFFIHLKHLLSTCEFGTFLKRASRDKCVCGLNDEKIQERLLSDDMSLDEVYKMAQAIELMTADVAHTKNKDREDLHKMCTTK